LRAEGSETGRVVDALKLTALEGRSLKRLPCVGPNEKGLRVSPEAFFIVRYQAQCA